MKLIPILKKKAENNGSVMVGAEPIFIEKGSKVGALLLHGFSSSPHQFKELSQFLASKDITVLAPLLKGHGTSPLEMAKTTRFDWKNSAEEAYSQLKEKVEKIIIIGNSFGGNLALSLAQKTDDSLIGIVSLNTPIRLKYHNFIKFRIFLYGWLKKYYRKPRRVYKIDYIDMSDEVTYSIIPVKCMSEFFRFIEEDTALNLEKVKTPILIAHANTDPVVDPGSATFIHEHLGSKHKIIYWFDSNQHGMIKEEKCYGLFERIYSFIKEII